MGKEGGPKETLYPLLKFLPEALSETLRFKAVLQKQGSGAGLFGSSLCIFSPAHAKGSASQSSAPPPPAQYTHTHTRYQPNNLVLCHSRRQLSLDSLGKRSRDGGKGDSADEGLDRLSPRATICACQVPKAKCLAGQIGQRLPMVKARAKTRPGALALGKRE